VDGLRWLLLLFGLLIIGGVYLYSRREKKKKDTPDDGSLERREPTLEGGKESLTDPGDKTQIEHSSDVEDDEAQQPAEDTPQKIVTLRIVGRDKKPFKGDELILSMRGIGLRHGKFGIFHRYDGNEESRTIFSAASLVEPGSFDLENIKEQQIPGISLFLVLPGPVEGAEAFDLMMEAARAIAQSLGGELLDETGSTLSIQRERYIREEIIQFQLSV
jgi:cell division protein ZipA